ncbi:hypothetical protein MACH09_18880 [Vibrio sp. MACH09]|uniref:DUF2249 domain-containing protein n=1 Tax=unclassified Vibrio TaxID=2614977 RepID=UPI001493B423|nr:MULTISPECIES: DUF2249 domain-containing protein [unclassified Vibrio]NOI66689.1 DUF2249 domain-containing protein [Vibrio sp. 99-8-1]GLO61380.1 hypothetical protein MACH09_18880 [Vibrio sp. MACH09]
MVNVTYLDVSELEPPQPMREICNTLATMSKGTVLHVFHRREPVPLYDMLREKYAFQHQQLQESCHHIYIWHLGDVKCEHYVRTALHANDRT